MLTAIGLCMSRIRTRRHRCFIHFLNITLSSQIVLTVIYSFRFEQQRKFIEKTVCEITAQIHFIKAATIDRQCQVPFLQHNSINKFQKSLFISFTSDFFFFFFGQEQDNGTVSLLL